MALPPREDGGAHYWQETRHRRIIRRGVPPHNAVQPGLPGPLGNQSVALVVRNRWSEQDLCRHDCCKFTVKASGREAKLPTRPSKERRRESALNWVAPTLTW